MSRQKSFSYQLKQRTLIDKAIVEINDESDRKLSISELSEISCYSVFHFQRIFSMLMGESCGEYIVRNRLTRAANLLVSNYDKINDIAIHVGFDTQTGFLKAFKKYYGTSPRRYRSDYFGGDFDLVSPRKKRRLLFLKPKLVQLTSTAAIVEYGQGIKDGHFDEVAWNSLQKISELAFNKTDLKPLLNNAFLALNKYSEIFKQDTAVFFSGMAVKNSVALKYKKWVNIHYIKGGFCAVFEHTGPLCEQTINAVLFDWLPTSSFQLDRDRPIFLRLKGLPVTDLYPGVFGEYS